MKKLTHFIVGIQRVAGTLAFVGDLVRACRPDPDLKRGGIVLDLYGHGPEEEKLRRLAAGAENIRFHDFVPVEQVREQMRDHDIYVLPSNAYEGWGAVVSEALEEGMCVLASMESGAGATILPPENLFRAGQWRELCEHLYQDREIKRCERWMNTYNAAEFLLSECNVFPLGS